MSGPLRVVLVSMPWASTERPSLPISLLSALVEKHGHRCITHYPNLRFASEIGVRAYEAMANETSFFGLDEHLFAVDLFGSERLASEEFLTSMIDPNSAGDPERSLRVLRDQVVPSFVAATAEEILALGPDVVGMTCTFNQTFSSIALARRIKSLKPSVTTLLGGPSVHDTMGVALAECFAACVDHVFTGEADESLPELLDQIAANAATVNVAGVTTRGAMSAPAHLVESLSAAPAPDFDGFFNCRSRLADEGLDVAPCTSLPYESSRGCWWGAKHHCTFCGLNNLGMRFRTRRDDQVVDDLVQLSDRYGLLSFMASDNILDFRAYGELLEQLASRGEEFELFYEIKANVKRRQVRQLALAGVRAVQPGVESFSDHVLQLMDKGVRVVQIVQLLKWLSEYSIEAIYNVLVGFPGESADDYAESVRVIEAIGDLPPPSGMTNLVEVHRFSPFHDAPDKYGLPDLRPCMFYRHLVPPDLLRPERFAFFFDRDIPASEPVHAERRSLDEAIARWRQTTSRRRARLGASFVEIVANGEQGRRRHTVLRGAQAVAFVALDRAARLDRFIDDLALDTGFDRAAAVEVVASLQAIRAILVVDGSAVAVVPFDRPQTNERLTDWLQANGAPRLTSRDASPDCGVRPAYIPLRTRRPAAANCTP